MDTGAPFAFRFVTAPPDLAPYLNSLYILTVDARGLNEMLPAYSGQLMVVRRGSGRMDFGEGFVEAPPEAFFTGPLSQACRFAIDGPATVLGASFTFLGWAALTRLPATIYSDRFVSAAAGLGEVLADRATELARAALPEEADALDRLVAILRERAAPPPPAHAELIEATYGWLNSGLKPDIDVLYDAIPMSPRQVQRLVKRFFGLPPSRLKRRYRAIRAATLLSDPALDPARRAEVLDAFFDQSHMIREIREFTGRTPHILAQGEASVGAATLGAEGYGLVRIFAGEEAEQLSRRRE